MAALATAACDGPDFFTERSQIQLSIPSNPGWFVSGDPALVGSSLCLEYTHVREGDEPLAYTGASHEAIAACYETQVSGAGELDGDGCLSIASPGITAVELIRRPCELPDTFGDDRLALDGVAIADVRGAFSYAVDERIGFQKVSEHHDGALEVVLPALDRPGVVAAPGEAIEVLERGDRGQSSIATQVVLERSGARVVATGVSASATVVTGTPVFPPDNHGPSVRYEAVAGDAFHVALSVPGGIVDVGEVRIAPMSTIASLELEPRMIRLAGTDQFVSLGADAVARNAEGTVLRRPPVEWSKVEGSGDVEPEYGELVRVCEDATPGERRSAVLEGRVNGLVETVEVKWQCYEGDVEDSGCGCRASGNSTAGWGVLALLGLAGLRTRRSRSSSACRSSLGPRRDRPRARRSP